MSFHVFFSFSTGLAETLTVPKGTKATFLSHVEEVETTLGLKRETFGEGEEARIAWNHWDDNWKRGFPDVDDKALCETVRQHNEWVRWVYGRFAAWSKAPVADGETLTPDDAKTFWHGLSTLSVDPARWTREYYIDRMEHMYEVMRGREHEGVTFDEKALTQKQCSAVIRLFENFLDSNDCRLDVPNGRDYLASSYDGGYDWCEKCGPVHPDDIGACRKRKCPLASEL